MDSAGLSEGIQHRCIARFWHLRGSVGGHYCHRCTRRRRQRCRCEPCQRQSRLLLWCGLLVLLAGSQYCRRTPRGQLFGGWHFGRGFWWRHQRREQQSKFTVSNLGRTDLTGISLAIDGPDAASFQATSTPAVSLGSSRSSFFTVAFHSLPCRAAKPPGCGSAAMTPAKVPSTLI